MKANVPSWLTRFLLLKAHKKTIHTTMRKTHVNGAAHEGTSLQSLLHDLVEIFGGLLHLVKLGHPTREVFHGLGGIAALKGFIGAVQSGHSRDKGHGWQCWTCMNMYMGGSKTKYGPAE